MIKRLLLTFLPLVLIPGIVGCLADLGGIVTDTCDPGFSSNELSSITGTVKSKAIKTPIENVIVELTGVESKSFKTDNQGMYTFSLLEPCRTYTLKATKEGYREESTNIFLELVEVFVIDLELIDSEKPKIIYDPTTLSEEPLNEVKISVTITDNELVNKAKLFFKLDFRQKIIEKL